MTRALAATLCVFLMACATHAPSPTFDLARFQSPFPDLGLTRGPDGWYLSRMDGPFGTDAGSVMLRFPFGTGGPQEVTFGTQSAAGRDFTWDARSQQGCFVRDADIWCASWNGEAWRDAAPLPEPVNTAGYEASPHIAPDGTLYFTSIRDDGIGQGDIYRDIANGDAWQVKALGTSINSPTGEWNLTLSPDGKIMVFEASGRPTNRTVPGDLYISCRTDEGWSTAVPMDALNTDDSDLDFRFISQREGVFTTAEMGGDGRLRYAAPDNFTICAGPR